MIDLIIGELRDDGLITWDGTVVCVEEPYKE